MSEADTGGEWLRSGNGVGDERPGRKKRAGAGTEKRGEMSDEG